MRALSLWQPWASLWLRCKIHETRDWELHHRGWLLVHAAKKPIRGIDGDPVAAIAAREFGSEWKTSLPFGALVGAVHIDDVVATRVLLKRWGVPPEPGPASVHWDDYNCGNFAAGRFAFKRAAEVRRCATPVPYRGQQGPFDVPESIAWPSIVT